MPEAGIVRVDLHGKNAYQARIALDAALRRANAGVYRLRAVHGYTRGTAIRDMIWMEYASRPGVIRLEAVSQGVTDLILREFV